MLDAFIIERIKKEREEQNSALFPLRIEIPHVPEDAPPAPAGADLPSHGLVIVDNQIE